MSKQQEHKKWEVQQSHYIIDDRWLKLRADSCLTPDGGFKDPFYIIEYPDWINCVVIDDRNNVLMLKHYRHGAQEYVPEIIGGILEATDESPLAAIRRELNEELGYVGGEVFETGISYPNPAIQTNIVYSFLAVGGSRQNDQQLEAGENLYVEEIPFQTFIKSIKNSNSGTLYQSLHLASIFFSLNLIQQSEAEALEPLKKYL